MIFVAVALAAEPVQLQDLPATHTGAIRVKATVDVHADEAHVWTALLDFPARMGGNSSLKSVTAYKPATPTDQWVRWEASRFGFAVVYHNHYLLSADHHTLVHELDASQPNDIKWSRGTYTLSTGSCDGCTHLVYDVESDFGVSMPGFVQSWLTGSGVRDFMADIARRAEGA